MTVNRNGEVINTDPGHHRQARLRHPQRHQGRAGQGVLRPDEELHHRHRRGQRRLLRPAGLLGHPGDLERRVRARRALVRGLPGLRQRQPRLHRHEHRATPSGSSTTFSVGDIVQVVNSDGDTMDAVRQRLRRLEPQLEEWREGSALWAAPRTPPNPAERARLRPESVLSAADAVPDAVRPPSPPSPGPADGGHVPGRGPRAPALRRLEVLAAQQGGQRVGERHRVHRMGHRRVRTAPGGQPGVLGAPDQHAAPAGSGRSRP